MASIAEIQKIYREMLGRDADKAGLDHWSKSGLSADGVRSGLTSSQEYRRHQIGSMYESELGRAADSGGLNYWLNSNASLDQIRSSLSGSPEAKRRGNWGKTAMADQPGGQFNDEIFKASPLYQRYVRQTNADVSDLNGALNIFRAQQRGRMLRERGVFNSQRDKATTRVNDDFESRGLYQSGARTGQLDKENSYIQADQSKFEGNIQGDITARESQTAQDISRLRRNLGERRLDVSEDLTRRSASL